MQVRISLVCSPVPKPISLSWKPNILGLFLTPPFSNINPIKKNISNAQSLQPQWVLLTLVSRPATLDVGRALRSFCYLLVYTLGPQSPWEIQFFRTLELGKFVVKVCPRRDVPEFSSVIYERAIKKQIWLSDLICLFSLYDSNFKSSRAESANGVVLLTCKSPQHPPAGSRPTQL